VLDVPDSDVDDSRNQRQPQREEKMQQKQERNQEQIPGEWHTEQNQEDKKDHRQDEVVDVPGQNIGKGKGHLGHINPFDHRLVVDDGGCGNGDGLLNHHPGRQARQEKNGVVLDLKFDDLGKNDGQDQKIEEGVENCPEETEDGIPVAELELSHGEVEKEVAILDELQKALFHLACCSPYSITKKGRFSFENQENRPVSAFFL